MGIAAAWQKFFIRPEIFVYIAPFVFTAVFLLLGKNASGDAQGIIEYYVNLNWRSFAWTAGILVAGFYVYAIVFWIKAIVYKLDPIEVFSRKNLAFQISKIPGMLGNVVFVGIPFGLGFSIMTLAIGHLNVFNSTRLRDELLFSWDVFLTGTFPALSLAFIQYPDWFIKAVEFSFLYLVPICMLLAVYLFLARARLFREAAGAFFLSLFIMFAGWYMFPVLSPHDRFVTDEYDLSVPAEVQVYADIYQPQKEIAAFWDTIHESRKNLSVLPTTALPSAHVVWAVLLVYYSWRVWKWLLLASVPLAVLSTLGTNLFAAHYFVDIPAGVITAIVSIGIVCWIGKKQFELERKSSIIAP
jgi:hypothetical protein